jgi:hypothetical protein
MDTDRKRTSSHASPEPADERHDRPNIAVASSHAASPARKPGFSTASLGCKMPRAANQPRITVIGVYSLEASPERLEQFINDYLTRTRERLAQTGIKVSDSDERWADIARQLRSALRPAALIEALVENVDNRFDPGEFVQRDWRQPEDRWQVAWEEAFLTANGEEILCDHRTQLPAGETFRIAFYIHSWKHGQPLLSSYGPLEYPQLTPIPERLWGLAPYALVD